MILDTNFLGLLKNGNRAAYSKAQNLEASEAELRIPSVVIYELYISVGKTPCRQYKIADQQAYHKLARSKRIVDATEDICKKAGVLEGAHQRSDSKSELGPVDAIVAAIGLKFNEPVVTDDADFQDVDGLEVESI